MTFRHVYNLIMHEGGMEDFSIYYDFSVGIINGQVANLYKAVLLCRTKFLYFAFEKKLIEYIEDP